MDLYQPPLSVTLPTTHTHARCTAALSMPLPRLRTFTARAHPSCSLPAHALHTHTSPAHTMRHATPCNMYYSVVVGLHVCATSKHAAIIFNLSQEKHQCVRQSNSSLRIQLLLFSNILHTSFTHTPHIFYCAQMCRSCYPYLNSTHTFIPPIPMTGG